MDELLRAESDLLVFVELYLHRVPPDEHMRSSLDSSKTDSRACMIIGDPPRSPFPLRFHSDSSTD